MIENIFSPRLVDFLRSLPGSNGHSPTIDIDNIDRDIIELVVAGNFHLEQRGILWVVGENENLQEKKEKLSLWFDFLSTQEKPKICFYTSPFEDPYINNSSDLNAVSRKMRFISILRRGQPAIAITTLSALNIQIEAPHRWDEFFLEIAIDREIARDDFTRQLIAMGYQARNIVEEKGDIAWRGSIVDVFPVYKKNPVRIEIEGGQVVSMRVFDPTTQKSIGKTKRVILPLARFFLDYDGSQQYFDSDREGMEYLPMLLQAREYKVIVSDRRRIKEEFAKLLTHYEKIYEIALQTDDSGDSGGNLIPPQEVNRIFTFPFDDLPVLSVNETFDSIDTPVELIKLPKSLAEFNYGDISQVKDKVENRGYKMFVCSGEERTQASLQDNISNFVIVENRIPNSFENEFTKCIFLAGRSYQFFEKFETLQQLEKGETRSESLVKEIQFEDYVVHIKHGVGKFVGFKRLGIGGDMVEYLKIEYLNQEYLYVPVHEIDSLSKYLTFEGISPKLDKMGGSSWSTKRKRAKKSIITFAKELLDLYALRKAMPGSQYYKESDWEDKLAEQFSFVETTDQKRAIRDVLRDLEAEYPMDRLICGDVSFGKTEVAIRAALRVVASGQQVAFLCPTTILSYQHYTTFKKRFSSFPITIALLSRMVTGKKKKAVYEELAKGKIDIVIGTHALISKEIKFSNLGLYIIDEEQRFGVFQKEKLKKNRETVDVLSLSATPIPRTLSLSFAGLQDISVIQTPPIGRLAIKNYVGYFSKEILTSAVLNEIERQGQVFIVYNNINKIYTFKEDLAQWLPSVPVTIIHAQMKTEDIESNLMDFIEKKYPVLLSTTIIENGIDIPDVNTLIVIDADRFGLTQLYQLRGRIGRGNRQAYAYFLVRSPSMSDKAKSRLDAIREFTDLGSGYKLAEFDLKLRGAGSLLGNRQHGHIEALGFDYYHQVLTETIKELKGGIDRRTEPKISMDFSYSIDPGYIEDSTQRISFYRRILEASEFDQIEDIRSDLTDRYGRPPDSIEKIFYAGMTRVLTKKYGFEKIDVSLDGIIITFADPAEKDLILTLDITKRFDGQEVDEKSAAFFYDFSDYEKFIEGIREIMETLSSEEQEVES